MEKKKLSEVETEKLRELHRSLEVEKEAMEHTISQLERELFCRDNPKMKKYHLDTYVYVD